MHRLARGRVRPRLDVVTTTEFWQQVYLVALQRGPNPDRAKAIADGAVVALGGLQTSPGAPSPVYRLRNGGQYLYTIDPAERDSAIATYGYTLEGVAFYAFPAA